MPTYIVLYKFSEEGRMNIRHIIDQAADTRVHHEELGFKILGTYWTLGQYDFVALVEAPSEHEMMAGMLNIMEAGNVVSETLRAFDETEMLKVLNSPNKWATRSRPRRLQRAARAARGSANQTDEEST